MRKLHPILPTLPVIGMLAGATLANPAAAADFTGDAVRWALSAPTMAAVDVFLAVIACAFVALAVATVAVRAWDAYAPRVARAIGRHAFRVARAAYRAAR